MPLSTEVFVMCVFIVGLPFFYLTQRKSELPGSLFFILAFIFLTLSNIATVVEEFAYNRLFNFCEHFLIFSAAIMIAIAVLKLTSGKKGKRG